MLALVLDSLLDGGQVPELEPGMEQEQDAEQDAGMASDKVLDRVLDTVQDAERVPGRWATISTLVSNTELLVATSMALLVVTSTELDYILELLESDSDTRQVLGKWG